MFVNLLNSLVSNSMLSQAVCVPAETAINHLLSHDPAALKAIQAQAGRLVCVEVDELTPVYIRLLDSGIALSLHNEARPDVIMRGSLPDFLSMANADNKANQLINSAIDMDGDTELSIALTKVAQQLDIDWEALIEPLTGGLVAHQLGKSVRGLIKWSHSTGSTYKVATKEYLEDEAQLVTPEPLLSEFADQIDQLRFASDRLQARLERLQQQQKSAPADLTDKADDSHPSS